MDEGKQCFRLKQRHKIYNSPDPNYYLALNIHKKGTESPKFMYMTDYLTEVPIAEDPEAGVWYKFVIQYTIGSSKANFFVYNADGSLKGSRMEVRLPSPIPQVNTIKLEQENGGYDSYFDDASWTVDPPKEVLSNVGTTTLSIENYGAEPLELTLSHYLLKGNSIRQDGNRSITLGTGLSQLSFSYPDLNKADASYSVIVGLAYDGRAKMLSGSIVTNSPPLIEPMQGINTNAGHIVEIHPSATDAEGDNISYTISEPLGNDGIWQTDSGDEGDYNIIITASDGLLSSASTVKVHVGPPVIDCNLNTDCGTNAFVDEHVCLDSGKMVNVYRRNICNMAGTIYSTCSWIDENLEIGNCGLSAAFSDDKDKEILDFYAPGSKTIYLSLPGNAKVKEATLDVLGYGKQEGCFYDDFYNQNYIDASETDSLWTDRFFSGNYYYTLPFSGTIEVASQNITRDMLYFSNIPTTIASPTLSESGVASAVFLYGAQWSGQTVWRLFVDLSCDNGTGWTDWAPYFQFNPRWYALPFGESSGELCRLSSGNSYSLNWRYNFSPPPTTSALWGIWTGQWWNSQPAYRLEVSQFAPEAKVVSNALQLPRLEKIYLDADSILYGNDAVEYYVSADDGSSWLPISSNQWITLPEIKQDAKLKWKAVLKSTHKAYAPRLFDMNLCYETVPPSLNPKIDVGNDSLLEWMYEGSYSGFETTADFSVALNDYLSPYSESEENILVPLTVSSDSKGEIILQNLSIKYVTEEKLSPSIISYLPLSDPEISELESQDFSIIAFDPNNDLLTTTWFVDGNLQAEGERFSYYADYYSSGRHEVKVVVSDGVNSTEKAWLLKIKDVPFACSSSDDCDDSNIFTIDTCVNPETPEAYCMHEGIRCFTNADCSDSNNYTADTCNSPGTASSSCSYTPVKCCVNSDCGTDGYVGAKFCLNNDVYMTFRSYLCNQPGIASSFCSFSDSNRLQQDCGDTTYGPWGSNYCSGSNVMHQRVVHNKGCSSGTCFANDTNEAVVVQSCPQACLNGNCVSIKCSNDSQCNDSNSYTVDECVSPETPSSYCSHTPIRCLNNADCYDANISTIDSCISPGIVSSYCRYDYGCAATVKGDVDGDNQVTAVDVQTVINAALGIPAAAGNPCTDIDKNGEINVVDVQLVINIALGITEHSFSPLKKDITLVKGNSQDFKVTLEDNPATDVKVDWLKDNVFAVQNTYSYTLSTSGLACGLHRVDANVNDPVQSLSRVNSWSVRIIDTNCGLLPEQGPCKALFYKYYYDQSAASCKEFIWGGCLGVVPFQSLEACRAACEFS